MLLGFDWLEVTATDDGVRGKDDAASSYAAIPSMEWCRAPDTTHQTTYQWNSSIWFFPNFWLYTTLFNIENSEIRTPVLPKMKWQAWRVVWQLNISIFQKKEKKKNLHDPLKNHNDFRANLQVTSSRQSPSWKAFTFECSHIILWDHKTSFEKLLVCYQSGPAEMVCFVFKAPRHFLFGMGVLWGNCKFLLEHFKGTMATTRGNGGNPFHCLCEVSDLVL